MRYKVRRGLVALFSFLLFFSSTTWAQHFFPDDKSLVAGFSDKISSVAILKNGVAGGGYGNFHARYISNQIISQIKLQNELLERPEFLEHLHEFRPLEEFAIGTTNSRIETSLSFTAELLDGAEKAVNALSSSINKKNRENKIKHLKQEIESILERLDNKGPEGLLIGIMSSLPSEAKDELLSKETMEAKISFLEELVETQRVDENDFYENFDFSKHDLGSEEPNFSSLVTELKNRAEQVDKLLNLIFLVNLVTDKKQITRSNLKKVILNLYNLSTDDLKELLTEFDVDFGKSIQSLISWHKRTHSTKIKTEKNSYKKDFTLIELPPYISIFRGCFGGDCSTTYSWAYPNSPMEKVFYIERKGRVVGYVSLTIVKIKGERYLLLKDLQGPNISKEIARVTIDFLHFHFSKKMETLGLAITNKGFIETNNYYKPLKEVLFEKISSVGKTHQVKFIDSTIRTFLGNKVSSSGYDSPSVHSKATIYKPEIENFEKIFKSKKSRFDYFPIDSEELEETVYRLDQELINKAVYEGYDPETLKLSLRENAAVSKILSAFNKRYKSVITFDEDITEALSEYLPEEEIEKLRQNRKDLFIKARLKVSDVFKTSVMSEFMRTHQELFWLFENAEDLTELISLFKIKIIKEPDSWFIDKLQEYFKDGGESVLNNVSTLYGAGLRFLDEGDEPRVLERIKNDFFLNFSEFTTVEEGHFRYISSDKYNKLLSKIDVSFSYDSKSIDDIKNVLNEFLSLIGVSHEEAMNHPILAQAFVTHLISKIKVKDNAQMISELILNLEPEVQLSIFKKVFNFYKEKVLDAHRNTHYYFSRDKSLKRAIDLLALFYSLDLEHINDTAMTRKLVREKKKLKRTNHGTELLLTLYQKKLTGMRKSELKETLAQIFDLSKITYEELVLLKDYDEQGLSIKIEPYHIDAILRRVTSENDETLLENLLSFVFEREFKVVNSRASKIRSKLTSLSDDSSDTARILLMQIWIKALDTALTEQQQQALKRDIDKVNYEYLPSLYKEKYNQIVEIYKPTLVKTCQGILK